MQIVLTFLPDFFFLVFPFKCLKRPVSDYDRRKVEVHGKHQTIVNLVENKELLQFISIIIVYNCLYVSPKCTRSYNIVNSVYIVKRLWGAEKLKNVNNIPYVSYDKSLSASGLFVKHQSLK